jgi:phytoene synthase
VAELDDSVGQAVGQDGVNGAVEVPAPPSHDLADLMRARVRASGTSFYGAMRLLPRRRQAAMYAIYAFCREVDDIADGDLPRSEKLAGLDEWRQRIDDLYAGRPRHPVTQALREPVEAYRIRREDFLAVIDGMEMDAREDIRAPSLADLDLYCARVASAVGRLSVRAFGETSAQADLVARHLGRALQLTNILRDLAEDADTGRLYLPREVLERHGIETREPEAVLAHPSLPGVCGEVAAMARDHFEKALEAMATCDRRAMRPAAVMGAVYRRLLDRLVAGGFHDIRTPVRVPTPIKIWLALRHGLL